MTLNTKAKKTVNKKPTFTEKARKKQILEISFELFREKGFDQTSIADIAAAAGVSRGVIFYYFESKGELGEEVIRQSLREYGRYVQTRINQKSSAIEKLLEFVDACLDYTNEHRDNWLVYVNTIGRFGNNSEKNNLLVWMSDRTQENLITIILQGQQNGEIEAYPAQELSYILHGVVDGLMSLVAIQPDKLDILSSKKLLKTILLRVVKIHKTDRT